MSTHSVLVFPGQSKPRPAKARLRADVQASVRQLITLAPILGAQNPNSVAPLVQHVRCLIPHPPTGGHEQEHDARRNAAAETIPPRRRAGRQYSQGRRWDDAYASALAAFDLALGQAPAAWRRPSRSACA